MYNMINLMVLTDWVHVWMKVNIMCNIELVYSTVHDAFKCKQIEYPA